MRIRDQMRAIGLIGALVSVSPGAHAQQSVVQPQQGQDSAQMQRDMADCQAIAKQSTSTQAAAPTSQRRAGGRLRGAAVGAAAGAVGAEVRGQQHEAYDRLSDDAKQEYRQNRAGSGAAVGAVVGGARQRQARRQDRQAQQQQQSAQATSYQQAYGACLRGRGYTVTP